jgi:SNF2 family DNA or RNA helicase
MKVSTSKPFQIVYSIYQHEFLGYLLESFVVQKDHNGRLTLQNQNLSAANAAEFAAGLDHNDYEMIKVIDTIQQDYVVRKFNRSRLTAAEFLHKYYDPEHEDKNLQEQINVYLEKKKARIFALMKGKMLFEMGNDGEPTWKRIYVEEKKALVTFHFIRNASDTQYFPSISLSNHYVQFQFRGAYLPCKSPAWMVVDDRLYGFSGEIDGNKLQPFLDRKTITIPKKIEDNYYRKFVAPLVASFDVHASGFNIVTVKPKLTPVLGFSEVHEAKLVSSYNEETDEEIDDLKDEHILFNLVFKYDDFRFDSDSFSGVSVKVREESGNYTFHRVLRQIENEKKFISLLRTLGLETLDGRATLPKLKAFTWLNQNKQSLEDIGFLIEQYESEEKKYFIGKSSIVFEIRESIDWFDIYAIIRFGDFEIPFNELRRIVMLKGNEITLPNGEIAVIPETWLIEYSELFAFVEDVKGSNAHTTYHLRKHHLALVKELEKGSLARVTMSRKLEQLRNFEEIDDEVIPVNFIGSLRPYQKAGFNWLYFLHKYRFGGCLADDMGLGKTVQTLAMLQSLKEREQTNASLLVMPTSLIYNWEIEARRFTPGLKVLVYTGTNREKDMSRFSEYDLVLTSYGIVRLDIDLLSGFYFNYVILDESQAIKNPNSNISKSVRKLKSKFRLILTGTPLENSTLDLWSQMTFVNPGLLGNQTFFKNEFLTPIEKKKDEDKTRKLNAIIKPFILRRHKSQVARELPEKVENIKYCSMTPEQEKHYEEAKSFFRNKILDTIETYGVKKSHFILLQGLTKLRQIANHPKMVDETYEGDSGKMEDIIIMINNAISENHKILVFSQFVKHLAIVGDYLNKNIIRYAYLDGSTKDREAQVNLFQDDDSVGIFLISLKAGGLGLNLTKADYVFLLDPWWNPAVEQQAIDRAHRIGQENKVFTYKFITKDTVEEKIIALQNHKIKLATDLITTDESFFKELTAEDIKSLLE